MKHIIIYEKINDGSLPDNYFYAHIPAFDLTTHGIGIEGAKVAAEDLIKLWQKKNRLLSFFYFNNI